MLARNTQMVAKDGTQDEEYTLWSIREAITMVSESAIKDMVSA